MSLSSFIFGLIFLITVGNLSVNARRFGKKGRFYVSPKQRPAPQHARNIAFLKRPSVVCHCSYRKYLKLKSRNLLRRGVVFKLNHGKKLEKKSNSPGVIYAPLCCNIDLSNPNKLYRYPMTIRLTEKAFTEKYKDSESAEFQELSNELINSINQLVSDASSLINVEVSGFRPGSIIVDLILTTKGIFPQELYDTLKFSIESGQLGNLQVALVPESKLPTQEGSEQTATKPGESTETTPEGAGTNVITPDESAGTDTTTTTSTDTTATTGTDTTTTTGTDTTTTTVTKPGDTGTDVITPTDTDTTGTLPESKLPTQEGSEQTGTKPGESTEITPEGAGTNVITPNESAGTDTTTTTGTDTTTTTGTKPGDTGTDVISPTDTDATGTLPESKLPTQEGSEETGTKPEGAGTNVITPNESAGTDTTTTTGTKPGDTGTDVITPTNTDTTGNLPESKLPTQEGSEQTGAKPGESTEITPEGAGTNVITPNESAGTDTTTTTGTKPGDTGTDVITPTDTDTTGNLPGESTGTTSTTPDSTGNTATSTTDTGDAYQNECVCAHNQKRKAHGTSPLIWSAEIAASAQEFANKLAAADSVDIKHGKSGYGENLYVAYGTAPLPKDRKGTCVKAVDEWYDEIAEYDFNNPGFNSKTGHFTQVVWKTTAQFGVGEALTSTNKRFVVARYKPAGNMMGEFEQNVPRPLTGSPAPASTECINAAGTTPTDTETGPGTGALNPTPKVPEDTDILTSPAATPNPLTTGETGGVTLNPLTGATLSPPTPSGNVGMTPNTLSGGLTESGTPKPTLNPLTGATLSPPTPSGNVGETPNTISGGLTEPGTPKPTLNPLTGATLSPPTPSGNVGETPNTLSGGLTESGTPKPTLNPLTSATLSPLTPSGNVGETPNPLSGGLTESGTPKPTLNPLTGATLSPPTPSGNIGETPNPLSGGLTEPGTPKPTLNPLTGATLSPPTPSGNVGVTPNTLSGGLTESPEPTLNPLTGATLSPPTPSGNVGVTPNTLSGGLTESPEPTLNPLTGATLSPPTSGNVGVTPNPLSPSVTPNPISPSVMPSATKPSEPTDARPKKPYDPSTPAKLIKAVIGLVGQVFTAALSNPATEEYQKAKNAIEQAIMSVFDAIQSFRSVSLTGFRPGESKRNRKLFHAKRSSSASNTVNAEVELEFTEAKSNQLAPLEEEVADGKLNNIKVQPQISAAIITEDIQNHCPQTCMLTNMCQPQCPIQCCTPPTTNTCQQQACPSACAPGCTTACCSLGSSAHLVKKSTKLTKSYKR